jgi:hypothetical protein
VQAALVPMAVVVMELVLVLALEPRYCHSSLEGTELPLQTMLFATASRLHQH